MQTKDPVQRAERPVPHPFWFRCLMCIAAVTLLTTWAGATEKGASAYPAGVETVMPGMTPPPGGTMFLEFDTSYQANQLVDSKGHSEVPGFNLNVWAIAPKVVHNWGLQLLGGTLVTAYAIPLVHETVQLPVGSASKVGLGNPEIGVAYVAYNTGNLHWWYGLDVLPPGLSYHKNDLVNIGQHNFSTVPVGAFTYLPNHGKTEISSRLQYILNGPDHSTGYHSGDEFLLEYDTMQNVTKKVAMGFNGYYYQQMTDDRLNGLSVPGGNRGRDLAVGPEIRCHIGHLALIGKYERDTLVQNKTRGNAFWLQLGVPVAHGHTPSVKVASTRD
jgi:hypothetical protein